jgi:hypothetical protein
MAIQILEFWPDSLEDAGVTWNVEFHMLVKQVATGQIEWQYYGTDPVAVPPSGINSNAPVVEYARVQFPSGFNDLPAEEATYHLFQLGRLAGTNREGQY